MPQKRDPKGDSNNSNEDEDDVRSLIIKLEKNLIAHIDEKVETLSKDIQENKALITKAASTATSAYNLASDNSRQIELLVTRVTNLEGEKKKLNDSVSNLSLTNAKQAIQISVLQRRLEDQTCRNSRYSLIIRGVPEGEGEKSWVDTRNVLCNNHSTYLVHCSPNAAL